MKELYMILVGIFGLVTGMALVLNYEIIIQAIGIWAFALIVLSVFIITIIGLTTAFEEEID